MPQTNLTSFLSNLRQTTRILSIHELYDIYSSHPSIQTDTRKLKEGDIFFALKGEKFNGNAFAQQALEAGASYAVVDEHAGTTGERLIHVEDVLSTLQLLAKMHREKFSIPFIAITGSNGKTTTKELIHAVLASQFKTYTTQGNLNNHIGVPLTLLSIKSDAEFAVIEMGANHQKEIESYCKIAQPTHGIITNCGKAHLEGFGGVEGVRKGKGELYDFIRDHDGLVFAYDDYDYLHEMSRGIRKVIWYGTNNGEVCGVVKSSEPFLEVKVKKGIDVGLLRTQLVGSYNLPNVLCAATVGKYFNVPNKKISTSIETYVPSNSRSQLIEIRTNKLILDAYNANPTSMKAAIENFARMHEKNKVLILGGMMELGAGSVEEHRAIIELIGRYRWNSVVLVGGDFKAINNSYMYFETADACLEWVRKQNFHDSYFLIKGSRSIQLEKVVNGFKN